ncbi:MAG: lipoyl synthase [Chitinivibrionales bacterium]|nr:lipoyl synthase [Chitinivibrionales bacterium]MBD3395902.1 lipoyl synthase [Chitinivibrionales bacterium]
MTNRKRLPYWLKRPIAKAGKLSAVQGQLDTHCLHTVCKEARCPNRTECFARGTATFLIMGNACSRDCRFCSVVHARPGQLDPREPEHVRDAAVKLGLSYVVVTSVTRDDLPDGGAGHFAATVRALKDAPSSIGVEVLIPDFRGSRQALQTVLESGPDVLNHNVETVPRRYPRIRPQADYRRSLEVLCRAAEYEPRVVVKSGLMVGLGETEDEVEAVLRDMHASGCSVVTIGQYLQPSSGQVPVARFVTPEEFVRYEELGRAIGFARVVSGPRVRSSYKAEKVFQTVMAQRTCPCPGN